MNAVPEAVPSPPLESYRAALEGWQVPGMGMAASENKPLRKAGGLDLSGKFALLLLDTVLWGACLGACVGLFHLTNVYLYIPNPWILVIPYVVSLFASWLVGGYDRDTSFVSLRFASESLIAGFVATLVGPGLVALFGNYGGAFQTSRLFLFLIPATFVVGSLMARRKLWRSQCRTTLRRVLVIGSEEEASSVESALHFP